MTADPREKLNLALAQLGRDADLRKRMVEICKMAEKLLIYEGSIREDITGPILDALHRGAGMLRKRLRSDVIIDFYYRSKIARDFVMSSPESPDHVWEPQTTKLLLYLSRGAKHVLVAGAYFGDQAILIAHQLRQGGGVCHAFEPDPDPFFMLQHNGAINGLENLRTVSKALWDNEGARLALVGEDAHAFASEDGEGAALPVTTIDRYLFEQGIPRLDVMMLDIEGGELRALRGAEGQLKLPASEAPILVFEVHRRYTDWDRGLTQTEILKYLASHGYKFFAVRDFQGNYDMGLRPIELIPANDVYLEGPPHGFNILGVKDSSWVHRDPFRICHGVSPKLLLHKDPQRYHPMDGL